MSFGFKCDMSTLSTHRDPDKITKDVLKCRFVATTRPFIATCSTTPFPKIAYRYMLDISFVRTPLYKKNTFIDIEQAS
jgi:hypothetical protein